MTNDESEKAADLVSLSGSPIYRHGDTSPWAAPSGEEFIQEISAHIEKHLGAVETVFHEIVSDAVHVDVHFVDLNRADVTAKRFGLW